MQIKSLWIKEYKNLKDFTINFEHQVSILIGKNGSGKSNILDAIVLIFRSLLPEKVRKVPFEYKMIYIFEWNEITVDNNFDSYNNTNIPKNVIWYYYKNTWRLPARFRWNKNFQALSVDSFNKILLSIWYSELDNHKKLFKKLNISKIIQFDFKILKSDKQGVYKSFINELLEFSKNTYDIISMWNTYFNFSWEVFKNEKFHEIFWDEKTFSEQSKICLINE